MSEKCHGCFTMKWIRKLTHDATAVRIAIPLAIVTDLGLNKCGFVSIEMGPDKTIIMKGVEHGKNEVADAAIGADRID